MPGLYLTDLEALTPVLRALVLLHDALAQGQTAPGQTLFGNPEDGEQITHRDSRIAAHEMNNPMMRPAKLMFPKYFVWRPNKIPISIEEVPYRASIIIGIRNLIIGL